MKVLFVRSGNAHRSPLAEALLRKLRPEWEVDSAGLQVAIPISEQVKGYLIEEGARRYLKKMPESLDSKQLEEYDIIVAMEQKHKDVVLMRCPQCRDRVAVWNIEDPYLLQGVQAKNVYDGIRARVVELAQSRNCS